MNRVHAIIVAGALALACVAVGASGASAASFGRCVKQTGGKYKNGNCTERGTEKKYEWYPAFGSAETQIEENPGFELELLEGGATFYVGSEGTETAFACTGATGTGKFSGNTEVAEVVITLTGCSVGPIKCTSAGAETGTIKSNVLDGAIGVWKSEGEERHNKVGLDLFPPKYEGLLFEMKCGELTRQERGSVIAMVPPSGPNKMGTRWELKFMRRGIEQMPEHFEGLEPPSPLLEQSINGGLEWKRTAVEASVSQITKAEVELNTTCTC